MNDVIVIGAGPAGLSAALTLGRMHRETVVIDGGAGRNAPAAAVHNLLLGEGLAPAELRRRGREQLAAYPSVRMLDATVSAVARSGGPGFDVMLTSGDRLTGRRLLLATGVADDLPPIDGLARRWGRTAFHCPYCHGWEVTGRRVTVLGGGPGRARLAVQLRRSFTDDVVLCTDGPARLDVAPAPVDHGEMQLPGASEADLLHDQLGWVDGGRGRRSPRSSAARSCPTARWRSTSSAGPAWPGSTRPVTWRTGRRCRWRCQRW